MELDKREIEQIGYYRRLVKKDTREKFETYEIATIREDNNGLFHL